MERRSAVISEACDLQDYKPVEQLKEQSSALIFQGGSRGEQNTPGRTLAKPVQIPVDPAQSDQRLLRWSTVALQTVQSDQGPSEESMTRGR